MTIGRGTRLSVKVHEHLYIICNINYNNTARY